jgi:hypothetical protein
VPGSAPRSVPVLVSWSVISLVLLVVLRAGTKKPLRHEG